MRSLKAAWEKAGQINHWDGAEDIDLDHPDVIAAYTPLFDGWKFVRADRGLLVIVMAQIAAISWLVAEAAFIVNIFPIWFKDAVSIIGFLVIIGVCCQFGWASLAARADDVFAGRRSGLTTVGRAMRGAFFLLPFGAVPALFLSRIMSIFVPVRLTSLRLWFGYDGFEVPARYWHLMTGFAGASRGVSLETAAHLTVDCRLKVYDIAAEDSRRYRAGLGIAFLIVPSVVAVSSVWPQLAYILALPIIFYMGIVVYHQAPAIVCLSHIYHSDFAKGKRDETLPPATATDRAGYLIYGAYGVVYLLLMYMAIAIPVGRDLSAHDEAAIDVGKIAIECKRKIAPERRRSLEDIAAENALIDKCVKAEYAAMIPNRVLLQSLEDYIAINRAEKSPAIIRRQLERPRQ